MCSFKFKISSFDESDRGLTLAHVGVTGGWAAAWRHCRSARQQRAAVMRQPALVGRRASRRPPALPLFGAQPLPAALLVVLLVLLLPAAAGPDATPRCRAGIHSTLTQTLGRDRWQRSWASTDGTHHLVLRQRVSSCLRGTPL